MPYQCVKCSRIISTGNKELLEGCAECHGKFFFYVREEQLQKLKEEQHILDLPDKDKENIEKDVREIAGIEDGLTPVILDLESVRILGEGKYEIDVVNLFNKKRPVIYKLEEGKYVIDLISSLSRRTSDEERKNS
jgi:predicted  nucleic acid-binding Zn-ribbon protein